MTLLTLTVPSSSWMFYVGLGALGIGLIVVLTLAIPRKRILTTEERVAQYAARAHAGIPAMGGPLPPPVSQSAAPFDSAKSAAANVLKRNRGLESRIAERLEGAASKWRPAEWLLLHVGVFVLVSAFGLLIGGGNLIVGLVFMALGAIGPWFYLGWRKKRRKKRFERQLPASADVGLAGCRPLAGTVRGHHRARGFRAGDQ